MTEPQRQGVGRRREDEECREHDERLGKVEQDLAKMNGYLKASGAIAGVLTLTVTILCTIIIGKLGNIETLVGKNDVILERHSLQIQANTEDIKTINERHKQFDSTNWGGIPRILRDGK